MRCNYFELINSLDLSYDEKVLLICELVDKVEKAIFDYDYENLELTIKDYEINGSLYEFSISYIDAYCIKSDFILGNKSLYEDAVKKCKNRRTKVRRLKHFIFSLFKRFNYVYFLTYSFSDKDLLITKKRRRYNVCNFLKSICNSYALNIDYGAINNREHYHATIGCNKKLNFKDFPTNIDFREVKNNCDDIEKISKYILKLSLHGCKNTTKYEKITYYNK